MKTYIVALFCLLFLSSVGFSQSPAENGLFEGLMGKDKSKALKALEDVLKTPDQQMSIVLFLCAKVAFEENRIEDAAFLFYAGQLRGEFDRECFPPSGSGGDNPFLAISAISDEIGYGINPKIMTDPKAFAKVVERLKKFSAKAPKEYDPGYKYSERKSENDAYEAVKPKWTEFFSGMESMLSLLNDPKYFAAFRVAQAYNFSDDADKHRPSKEEFDKARETMKQIAKEKGIEDFGH